MPLEIDGREIWLSIVGVTLADGIVYAFRDVTRERRLEELRAQFVATISHELRTPLASLHGAAMTLLEREHDLHEQTRHDLLDMIAVQSKRLADLVEEILLTGQLDSGSLRVVTEPFDPEELVWTAAAAARLRVSDDTTIDVSIPAVLPKVAGDAERTRQVLTQSHRQRDQVLAARRTDRARCRGRRGLRALHRPRRGPGHPAGRAEADLREVLSTRSGPSARHRGKRPRALHLPGARPLDERQDLGRAPIRARERRSRSSLPLAERVTALTAGASA